MQPASVVKALAAVGRRYCRLCHGAQRPYYKGEPPCREGLSRGDDMASAGPGGGAHVLEWRRL